MSMPPIKFISQEESRRNQAQKFLAQIHETVRNSSNPNIALAVALNDECEQWLGRFVTVDPAMLEVKDKVRLLAKVNDPVLIVGPSGTGKELIARALHGYRKTSRFHPVNCAGMPEQLIESELFGHVAGAFTGARGDNPGILRSAEDGTVFLDEIGEAPLELQAKLLRALQPGHNGKYYVRPVGGVQHYEITCRVIAATKRDLFQQVLDKTFREDLYGRLMAFELHLTSLTQRPLDKIAILKSLGCEDLSDIDNSYWTQYVNMFNVRALQAYARRKIVYEE